MALGCAAAAGARRTIIPTSIPGMMVMVSESNMLLSFFNSRVDKC